MANIEALGEIGIDPAELADEDLLRELRSLHRTRLDTLRHGAESALDNHLRRTADLETEYLARHPRREVDPHRLRDGAPTGGAPTGVSGADVLEADVLGDEGGGERIGPWNAGPSRYA